MDQETIKQLRLLFAEFDATLARVCTILNRAEARVDSLAAQPASQPAGFPPGLPPLPEPPPGMRWEYIGAGTGASGECIYTFPEWSRWQESYQLIPVKDIHYAVPVPA
jgi:hypothetical protein